jgi:uncharacterized protein YjbI with pentapeptide repeats
MHAKIVDRRAEEMAKRRSCIANIAPFVSRFLLVLLLVSLPVLAAWAAHEDDKKCPNPVGWQPREFALKDILNEHKDWLRQSGWLDTDVTGKAILCNADLSGTDLAKGNLRYADLRGADLSEANLIEANLSRADLSGATLVGAKLKDTNLFGANLHAASFFTSGPHASSSTDLSGAYLVNADLSEADLFGVNLTKAYLWRTNLQGASLISAQLQGAFLGAAKLNGADLSNADLQDAELEGSDLEGALLTNANLTNAIYEPISVPSRVHLSGLAGIATLQFGPGHQTGLVLLRKALQEAGLRQLEREATYAIEHSKNTHAFAGHGGGAEYKDGGLMKKDHLARAGAYFKLVFFESTTDWGLRPERALFILLTGIAVGWVLYLVALSQRPPSGKLSGIYREWPQGRIVEASGPPHPEGPATPCTVAEKADSERLQPESWRMILFALYFSLLSAFSIGWRDLNVGSWLTKLQFREYGLRARGWVRFVSGFQSLVSVYLVAIWVLTYFGRPFQ